MKELLKPSLNWLLVFVPAAVVLEKTQPNNHVLIFICACLAVLPLAGWLGHATEHLAEHTGEAVGGLLNATFGNAAELILAIAALRQGLYDVVKASLTGSIIGNLLLVAGLSFFCGGLKYRVQRFNAISARTQSTLLTLAAISMIIPACFHLLAVPNDRGDELNLSAEMAVILLLVYAASLVFSLVTHKKEVQAVASVPEETTEEPGEEEPEKPWSMGKSLGVLALVTVIIAWVSEILVGSVEQAAHSFGMTSIFVGVIVVAIIGNAAEHSTAILAALKNRMDMSLSVAIGSSLQIALFVAPLLVLLSHFIGPRSMDFVFTPAEVGAVILAVFITSQVASDGESNWLEGLLLLSVYLLLGISFYFLPEGAPHAGLAPAAHPGAAH